MPICDMEAAMAESDVRNVFQALQTSKQVLYESGSRLKNIFLKHFSRFFKLSLNANKFDLHLSYFSLRVRHYQELMVLEFTCFARLDWYSLH